MRHHKDQASDTAPENAAAEPTPCPTPQDLTHQAADPSAKGDSPRVEATAEVVDLGDLKAQAARAKENWDLYLRARAEFDNYRRRATRDRQEAVRYAGLAFVEKVLPVLDSFEKATEASSSGDGASLESLREGVNLVQSQLKNILSEAGVQEIDATGQAFDPNLHEAVAHSESAEVADGHVLQQVRKGYKLHDRLVRPASVVVAKKPSA